MFLISSRQSLVHATITCFEQFVMNTFKIHYKDLDAKYTT